MLHEATLEGLRQLPLQLRQDRRPSQVKRPRSILISNSLSYVFFLCSSINSYIKTNCKIRTSWRNARPVSGRSLRSKRHIVLWYSSGVQMFSFLPFCVCVCVCVCVYKAPPHSMWAGWRTTRVKSTVIGGHYLLNYYVIFILYIKFTNVAAGRGFHIAVVHG
jgi:hypothetical protein